MTEETDRLAAIAQPFDTIADKIRALSAAGVSRADIARFLGKRYQHVRNVLEGDAQSSGGYVLGKADLSGVRPPSIIDELGADDASLIERRGPGAYWLRVKADGSVVLPTELVDALNALPGKRIFARLEGDEVKIISGETATKRVRDMIRKYAPANSSVVDEFLAERRELWGEGDN